MDILAKIDEYKALLDRKDELAEQTKANNADIAKCREELAQLMIETETPKITRSGFHYSLQNKVKYSKAAGADEELFEALRANDLGDLIKETVSPQTLQAAMTNLAEENDGELPEDFDGIVNKYEFFDVSKRRAIAGSSRA